MNKTIDGGFYSCQCTCKVLAENSVDSVDYYITKVALDEDKRCYLCGAIKLNEGANGRMKTSGFSFYGPLQHIHGPLTSSRAPD